MFRRGQILESFYLNEISELKYNKFSFVLLSLFMGKKTYFSSMILADAGFKVFANAIACIVCIKCSLASDEKVFAEKLLSV